jgi:hypothetical protein
MEADLPGIVKEIEADPKLMLLAKAITELSEKQMVHDLALKTIQMILVDQQNSIKTMNESLQKIGEAVDVIIKQMFVISHHPAVPPSFKGVIIK